MSGWGPRGGAQWGNVTLLVEPDEQLLAAAQVDGQQLQADADVRLVDARLVEPDAEQLVVAGGSSCPRPLAQLLELGVSVV